MTSPNATTRNQIQDIALERQPVSVYLEAVSARDRAQAQ
jgi:hypothetical protein